MQLVLVVYAVTLIIRASAASKERDTIPLEARAVSSGSVPFPRVTNTRVRAYVCASVHMYWTYVMYLRNTTRRLSTRGREWVH